MELNLSPISGTSNRVIIEPVPTETKTASGIYIPESAKEKPCKGTVVSVSEEDSEGNKPTVKVGDVVLYSKYGGTDLPIDGKDYLIMRETDIYAVVLS